MTDLNSQLNIAEDTLASLRIQLDDLQRKVAVEEERVALLRRLLELDVPNSRAPDAVATASPRHTPVMRRKPVTLEDAVVDILAEHNESVHIGEIHSELRKRGVRIPGKGVDANIIARIIKEPRIEREAGRRGFYRLAQA